MRQTANSRLRKRATRLFLLRVFMLLVLMVTIAYGAWIAPRPRASRPIAVEVVR